MSRMQSILRNLRLLLTDDFSGRWQAEDARAEGLRRLLEEEEHRLLKVLSDLTQRHGEFEARVETRADTYEAAIDKRIAERLDSFETRLSLHQTAIDARIDERLKLLEERLDDYQVTVDARIDERLADSEKALEVRFAAHEERVDGRADEFEKSQSSRTDAFETALTSRLSGFEQAQTRRADNFEQTMTSRATEYESTTNQRLEAFEAVTAARADAYEAALDARIESRLTQTDEIVDKRLGEAEARLGSASGEAVKRIDLHFEERSLATDNRLDDRLARIERHIDSRFNTIEKRSDDRMETHVNTVDGRLHQRSQDIVDRNDLMLQIFDQQLDKFRRELRALEAGPRRAVQPAKGSESEAGNKGKDGDDELTGGSTSAGSEPPRQLISFRKLAEHGTQTLSKIGAGAPPLYEQILSWKKIAHEGLTDFAPHESEIVDYILSFLSDPQEVAYVKQHLRRFVSTIERIPAVENPEDRLLELGSFGHLAPALRKFCGYSEVFCGDFWKGDESVRIETVRQTEGADSHSFELRNFNVEIDKFPYPDGYFRTVLCCELIEHLQRDPLHMLWECNRVLADDGYLLLTTPNIASARAIEGLLVGCTPYLLNQYNLQEVADQHNREYAPYEIGVALAAAGFSVVALETEDVWLRSNPAVIDLLREIQISPELRGDNIFALARKVSAPIERYPVELYTGK